MQGRESKKSRTKKSQKKKLKIQFGIRKWKDENPREDSWLFFREINNKINDKIKRTVKT